MKPLGQVMEDWHYLHFLKEVRNITHRRFEKSQKRTRILDKITDEIHNLSKTSNRNLPNREEILQINRTLLERKEDSLQEALKELRQCEKEIGEQEELEKFEMNLQEINEILNSE